MDTGMEFSLRVQFDANNWDINSNTREETPYLQATVYNFVDDCIWQEWCKLTVISSSHRNFYTGIVTAFLRARNPCKNTFIIIEVSQKEISVFAQTEKAWKLCMLTL